MRRIIGILFLCLYYLNGYTAERVINLVAEYKTVNFTGTSRTAIVVNNQIPGPVLHFKEGDHVTINVYNHLDKATAIHWHGMLVPWQMDGVEGVTQKGIPPGGVFHYHFTLHQSGTYWYHAHAGLQEQQGLYGAFIIDPIKKPSYTYTKEFPIVLSDWSNTKPEQILANLKKSGDYYSPNFPLQASLQKFLHDYQNATPDEKKNILDDYKMMQHMRMGLYDLSDVAYDAFLLNGQANHTPWTQQVKVGDVVRLRFIGAAGSTIFNVKIPGSDMEVVNVDANDVKPYRVHTFSIAPGETLDALVHIIKDKPYIIYAESIDTVGAAYGALLTQPQQLPNYQNVQKFPEPQPPMRTMMALMMQSPEHAMPDSPEMHSGMMMDHEKMQANMPMPHAMPAGMHDMSMPTEPSTLGDRIEKPDGFKQTIGTKYQDLTAAVKTNDPTKPVDGVIRMQLSGYMGSYIWFINGEPEYKVHPIILEPNKRYRFIFTNTSMMRHPMHLHGHWFILRNGHGSHDPLLHTIDVPPGATVTADVDTDASGQWFFHCHLVYHMISGMSRVFQYSTLIELAHDQIKPEDIIKSTGYDNRPIVRVDEVRPLDKSLIHHPMAHGPGFWYSTYAEIGDDPFHNVPRLTYKGLYGPDFNKLELFMNDAEIDQDTVQNADLDIFYWHQISQFWALKGGMNYFYRPALVPYWQPGIGIEGLMPYFIDTDLRVYYFDGSTKGDLQLSRDNQITNNFFINVGIRSIAATKSIQRAQLGSGLNQMRYTIRPFYRFMPGYTVYMEYEHDQNYGPFRIYQQSLGQSGAQNTVTFGVTMLL